MSKLRLICKKLVQRQVEASEGAMQARLEAIPQPDKDIMYATPNFENIKQFATKQTMLYQLGGIRLGKFEQRVNEE